MIALFHKGYGPCRIAREAGVSRKQVARLLARERLTRDPRRSAGTMVTEILELRRQGLGFGAIGQRLGLSRNAVRRAFRNQTTSSPPAAEGTYPS